MSKVDLAAFREDYHNPKLRAALVAERYELAEGTLAQFAQKHGIESRRELGIRSPSKRQPTVEGLGSGGCRPSCPGWIDCRRHMGKEAPMCEVMSYLDENPALVDGEPVYSGGVALATRLYFAEDEL